MIKCLHKSCKNPAKWLVDDKPYCGVHSEAGKRERIGMQRFHIKDRAIVKREGIKRVD